MARYKVDVLPFEQMAAGAAVALNSPACVHCRITNRCSSVVQFSWRQYATAQEEFDSAAADMSDMLRQTSTLPVYTEEDMLDPLAAGLLQVKCA